MRGAAAAGVLTAVALLAGCSRGAKKTSAAGPAPSTTAPAASAPAPTTTTLPVFSGDGAFMTAPASPSAKPYDPDPACKTLVDPGFSGSCLPTTTPAGTIAAVNEQQDPHAQPGSESRELLYRREGDQWQLALRYSGHVSQDSGLLDSSTMADVAADGDNKAVFVLRDPGDESSTMTSIRAIDVAEATGEVVLHLALDHGVARAATGGGIEAWSRRTGTSPLQYRHLVIRYHAGAWRAETDETVRADDVPRPDAKESAGFY